MPRPILHRNTKSSRTTKPCVDEKCNVHLSHVKLPWVLIGYAYYPSLESTGLLEQLLEIPAIMCLKIRMAADMLLVDEYVRDGGLSRQFEQGALDGTAVVLQVELEVLVLCAIAVEYALGGSGVAAVGLAKDD